MKSYSQLLKELNVTIGTKGIRDKYLQGVKPIGNTTTLSADKIKDRLIRNPRFTK